MRSIKMKRVTKRHLPIYRLEYRYHIVIKVIIDRRLHIVGMPVPATTYKVQENTIVNKTT